MYKYVIFYGMRVVSTLCVWLRTKNHVLDILVQYFEQYSMWVEQHFQKFAQHCTVCTVT